MRSFVGFLFLASAAVAAAVDDNGTNDTEVYVPTLAPTPAPTQNTTFSFLVQLTSADQFDSKDLVKALALSMGVSEKDVEILETFFQVSTTLTLPGAVTKNDLAKVRTRLATDGGVAESAVTLSVGARRLSELAPRRLASHGGSMVSAVVELPTSQAQKVAALTPAAFVSGLAAALGIQESDIQADPVEIGVRGVTRVTSNASTPLRLPTAAELEDGLKQAAPNKTFNVAYVAKEDPQSQTPTPAPTSAPTSEEVEDSALGSSVSMACSVAAAIAMGMQLF